MICYISTGGHSYTITDYLQSWGDGLNCSVCIYSYGELANLRCSSGIVILSDLERLGARQAEAATRTYDEIRAANPGLWILNHPTLSMRRFELLRNLYENGVNEFNVYRMTDTRRPSKFPVFIRNEHDHDVSCIRLVSSQTELSEALHTWGLQGRSREDGIIEEFCDTSDSDGIYRKYSAFVVGDSVVPRHIFFSRKWIVKTPTETESKFLEEEWSYVRNNPHRDFIREVFRLANIQYGRIDYSIKDGRIQVWEINTNPLIASADEKDFEPRLRVHKHFTASLNSLLNRSSNWSARKKARLVTERIVRSVGLSAVEAPIISGLKRIERVLR